MGFPRRRICDWFAASSIDQFINFKDFCIDNELRKTFYSKRVLNDTWSLEKKAIELLYITILYYRVTNDNFFPIGTRRIFLVLL